MKKTLSRLAGLGLSVVVAGNIAAAHDFDASKAYGAECFAMIEGHASGLVSVTAMSEAPVEKRVMVAGNEFRLLMAAAKTASNCYAKLAATPEGVKHSEDLQKSAKMTAAIFDKSQAQFGLWIEEVSTSLLSSVAPAAGGDAPVDGEGLQIEAGLEMLIDSYLLLENAAALSDEITSR